MEKKRLNKIKKKERKKETAFLRQCFSQPWGLLGRQKSPKELADSHFPTLGLQVTLSYLHFLVVLGIKIRSPCVHTKQGID